MNIKNKYNYKRPHILPSERSDNIVQDKFGNGCDHQSKETIKISDEIQLYQCQHCALIFRESNGKDHNPTINYDNYYRNEISSRFNPLVEFFVKAFRFYRALKVMIISPRARSILDIGSGRGFMLYFLKKYFGFKEAVGTQISKPAMDYSRDVLGLEIYGEDLLEHDWQGRHFDVISMWHVLEHVPFPEQYIVKIGSLLNERGKLIIEVPNYNSWTRPFTKKYWLGLDIKHHISQFTPESLKFLLQKHGFSILLVHTFSLEYSTFISAQSIVSWLTGTDRVVFNWLQHGGYSWQLIPHFLLFIILAPIYLAINLILFFSKKGEVLFIVAAKSSA